MKSIKKLIDNIKKYTNKNRFKKLICVIKDGEKTVDFSNLDDYIQEGFKIYETIGINKYIKEIKIVNSLDCAGETKINAQDNKVEITISILLIELDYRRKERVHEFADVLAHELFHAQNNIDILEYVGIEEYKSIRYSKDSWFKLTWIIFDEYCACRKNAEKFNSFKSVESEEKIERIFNYLQSVYKDPNLIIAIKNLFYSIATISAFADVSNEKEVIILAKLKKSKNLFKEVRVLFNCFYLDPSPSYKKYSDMACKLEQIYNSHELRKLY